MPQVDLCDALYHATALNTKLYAECDKQATVVSRLLTTLCNGGCATAKFL